MIIDLDSHLREGYFRRPGVTSSPPLSRSYTRSVIKEGEPHERRFKTKFERGAHGEGNSSPQPQLHVDPKENWKAGTLPGGR